MTSDLVSYTTSRCEMDIRLVLLPIQRLKHQLPIASVWRSSSYRRVGSTTEGDLH
jgi:hypothetical protein